MIFFVFLLISIGMGSISTFTYRDSTGMPKFHGKYDDSATKKGWRQLWIWPDSVVNASDPSLAFMAGYTEGYLTAQEIDAFLQTVEILGASQVWKSNSTRSKIAAFIEASHDWMMEQVKSNPKDPYWQNVNLISNQVDGIAAGASVALGRKISPAQIRFSNAFPDSMDIVNVVAPEMRPDWFRLPPKKVVELIAKQSHCSAYIKHGNGELFAAHTTWIFYSMLIRIYKHITIPFFNPAVKAHSVSFSSYPAQINSADDFYITNQHLVVIETTNSIFNTSLYNYCSPQSLLVYVRSTIANRLSKNGKEWSQVFSRYNSGTYNNQWMVVDMKNEKLEILEQIPGTIASGDQTHMLKSQGYWPSYNIPFYPKIFELSGYPKMVQQYGDQFSYTDCPRAKIFRRNESTADNMEQIKKLMRYNNYLIDPLSQGNPGFAISSRFDLQSEGAFPVGGIDSKITNKAMTKLQNAFAQCGPTHDSLPAFSWTAFNSWPHIDQPTVWNFGWNLMTSRHH